MDLGLCYSDVTSQLDKTQTTTQIGWWGERARDQLVIVRIVVVCSLDLNTVLIIVVRIL